MIHGASAAAISGIGPDASARAPRTALYAAWGCLRQDHLAEDPEQVLRAYNGGGPCVQWRCRVQWRCAARACREQCGAGSAPVHRRTMAGLTAPGTLEGIQWRRADWRGIMAGAFRRTCGRGCGRCGGCCGSSPSTAGSCPPRSRAGATGDPPP
eukprot:3197507-Rhodomonas_salina.2